MMRIGIYNKYWNTFGGGERHVTAIAAVLAAIRNVEVFLIGTEPFSLRELCERFQADLTRCHTVIWPSGHSCESLAPLTAGYDLFINSTYCSSLPSIARRSAYLCFFPHLLDRMERSDGVAPIAPGSARLAAGTFAPVAGHHGIQADGLCWFSGNGVLAVTVPAQKPRVARIPLQTPPQTQLTLIRAQHRSLRWRMSAGCLEVDLGPLALTSESQSIDLFIESTVFRPSEVIDSLDSRLLGACLNLQGVPHTDLSIPVRPANPNWLSTYELIIANSAYTAAWIKKRWNRDSVVLPPAIDTSLFCPAKAVPFARRDPVILSVGRFFAGGHNKKHDFLIETFKAMIAQGQLSPNWELHLVGGRHREQPHHLEYYERLLRLADDYPIRFFPDLPFDTLLAKYKQSSLYWHAAGVNECEETFPERFEHFGITTCEAMACGLIPIVIDRAGQKELVHDCMNGFSFSSRDELIEKTLRAVSILDTQAGTRLRKAARTTAERYSTSNVTSALLIKKLGLTPGNVSFLARSMRAIFTRLRRFHPSRTIVQRASNRTLNPRSSRPDSTGVV